MGHIDVHSLLSPGDEILHENFIFRTPRHNEITVRMKCIGRLPRDVAAMIAADLPTLPRLLAYRTSWPKASNWTDSNTVWTTIGVIAYSRQYHLKSRLSGFCCVDQFFQRIQISRAIVNE